VLTKKSQAEEDLIFIVAIGAVMALILGIYLFSSMNKILEGIPK